MQTASLKSVQLLASLYLYTLINYLSVVLLEGNVLLSGTKNKVFKLFLKREILDTLPIFTILSLAKIRLYANKKGEKQARPLFKHHLFALIIYRLQHPH